MKIRRVQMLGVSAIIAGGSILLCTWGCTSEPELRVEDFKSPPAAQAPAQPAGAPAAVPTGPPIKWTTPVPAPVVQPNQSAKPEAPPMADTHLTTVVYIVQVGDTLMGISRKYLGTEANWMQIFDANRNVMNSPTDLKPNMRLIIPGAKAGSSAFSTGGMPSH